jgi:hypothetical protein
MIPKKLYQTHKDYNLSEDTKRLITSFIGLNSDFHYTFMDNDECDKFIEGNFDSTFTSMYRSLPLDIMRADVWRVAVIYINGGVYSDCDVICNANLSKLIQGQELVIFKERQGSTSNFFFAAKPKHPALKAVLDLMVKRHKTAFDVYTDLLVQNFGMDAFHTIVEQVENKLVLSYDESLKWVTHLFHSTWRESEGKYKDDSKYQPPITFVTTFHNNGYELYGKSWIKSFTKNAAKQRNNIKAIVYAHDIPNLTTEHPQIEILDYDKTLPEHAAWKQEYLEKSGHTDHVKNFTIRFSHKGFTIQHALDTIKEGYVIWLDGDVIFKDYTYTNFPQVVLQNNEVIACQVEDGNHVESGILIFDVEHPDIEKFKESFKFNYSLDQILTTYGEPYDGYVVRRSLVNSEINFYDLNKDFGRGGIQSDPNETFLHPEIDTRFTHNIGITGKKNYSSWESVKQKDNIFAILEGSGFKPLTPKQLVFRNLRNKRLR